MKRARPPFDKKSKKAGPEGIGKEEQSGTTRTLDCCAEIFSKSEESMLLALKPWLFRVWTICWARVFSEPGKDSSSTEMVVCADAKVTLNKKAVRSRGAANFIFPE